MPKQSNGLTVMQRKFVVGIASGHDQKTAAEEAGYCHPAVAGYKLMQSQVVKRAMADLLEEEGLSDAFIARKLHQFCEAKKKDEIGEVPDFHVQLRGLEMLCRLRGLFKSEGKVEKTLSYEQKIELVQRIKENPQVAMTTIMRLIESRQGMISNE